jgi:2,3-bisphosphoglycerate-independent phosphoglycerate mutase
VSRRTRHLILLGDGMSDRPIAELGGRTPLQAAATPHLDRLAREGVLGRARTIPAGLAPGSDVANLSVLGYDPAAFYTGRSPLEAAGMGVALGPDDVAFRLNLVTLGAPSGAGEGDVSTGLGGLDPSLVMLDFAGGHPSRDEAALLLDALRKGLADEGIELFPGVSYRHLLVWRGGLDRLRVAPPHDLTDRPLAEGWPEGDGAAKVLSLVSRSISVLAGHPVNRARARAGKRPVNAIWLWGQGKRPRLAPFEERYGLTGAMITAVDLLRGIGACLGFDIIRVPGATGYLDTDYEGKAAAAAEALETRDLAFVHLEAPDEAGHGGSLSDKMRAIEEFDRRIVGPLLSGLEHRFPLRVLAMPDHATPLALKTHSDDPVPFAAWDSEARGAGSGRPFTEKDAEATGVAFPRGHELMGSFLAWNWPSFVPPERDFRLR